jgi:hypothetical protein
VDVDISAGGDPASPVVLKRTPNQKHPKRSSRLVGASNGPALVIPLLVVVRTLVEQADLLDDARGDTGTSDNLPLRCLCMSQVLACDGFHDLIVRSAWGLARGPDHNPTMRLARGSVLSELRLIRNERLAGSGLTVELGTTNLSIEAISRIQNHRRKRPSSRKRCTGQRRI